MVNWCLLMRWTPIIVIQAAKELGLKNAPISKICKQNKGTVYGYIWKFKSLLDNEKK